jgi:hypothetical protein
MHVRIAACMLVRVTAIKSPDRSDGVVDFQDLRGRCVVCKLHQDILWFQFEGTLSVAAWKPAETALEETIASHGSVMLIGNGWTWHTYGPGFRSAWTSWFLRRRAQVRGVHLLISSPMLRMGVQVVNLAIPIIQPYGAVDDFTSAVDRAAPTARRRVAALGPLLDDPWRLGGST